MHHAVCAFLLAALVIVLSQVQPPQLQRFYEEQVRIADIEVPRLIGLVGLEPGMNMADVGAGPGRPRIRDHDRWLRGHR